MHFDGVDEAFVPRSKRRCRTSKKKRLRLKKRVSLEPKVEVKCGDIEDKHDVQEQTQNEEKASENKELGNEQQQEQRQEDTTQDLNQNQDQHQQQNDGVEDKNHEREEISEYESKRRDNILRNQTIMEQVGVSAAKFEARTAIGDEAEKKAKRQELAKKRALKAASQTERMPTRKSRRIQGKKVDAELEDRRFVWTEMQTPRGDVIRFLKEIQKQ